MSTFDHGGNGIARVAEGVFFTTPPPLPRGPHKLPRERVLDAQRDRLLIAFTELLAAHGYAAISVGDIAARAGMSRSSFYDSFETREACADAAYEHYAAGLGLAVISELAEVDWGREANAVLRAYFTTLQRDLVVARAFHVEIDAAGAIARERRRHTVLRFAELIQTDHRRIAEHDPTLNKSVPLEAFVGIVYAARQLAADALEATDTPDLAGLATKITEWATASFQTPN